MSEPKYTKWNVILAVDLKNGIGLNGSIPWKNKLDMDYFRYATSYQIHPNPEKKKNLLVFGSRTKHGIHDDPKRDVIVLGKETGNNFSKVLSIADNYGKIFICGGDITYKNFYNFADEKKINYCIFKNFILNKYDVDTIHVAKPYFNDFTHDEKLCIGDIIITITHYNNRTKGYKNVQCNRNIMYNPYTKLLYHLTSVANSEHSRTTRNGKTYSDFGEILKFDLGDWGLGQVLPAKTLFCRGVIEELLFFLRGHTDTKLLEEKNIKIWKPNTEKTNGEMGPMYGYQLRNFGGHGVDQLKKIIESLKNDPYSRRHIMTMFNPEQADLGVLYPCHGIVIQFYIDSKDRLNLMMYQRSADAFLGLPFNIFSYSVLLMLMAKEIGRDPGELIISLGDYHLYESHLDKAELHIALHNLYTMDMYEFPILNISDNVSLSQGVYEYSDFVIEDYYPVGTINAEMYA